MTDSTALLLAAALVIVPVAGGVTLARRFGDKVTAFHWMLMACSYVGLLLALPLIEDAAEGRRPWSSALLVAAALVLLPVLYVASLALHHLPLVLLDLLVTRWRDRRNARRGP